MRQRDKKSYPQYEGTILKWHFSNSCVQKDAYVKIVGMDYDLGYTLVNADNLEENMTCINGPSSPNKDAREANADNYDILFQYLLDCVRNKKTYDVDERRKLADQEPAVSSGGAMASCVFNS